MITNKKLRHLSALLGSVFILSACATHNNTSLSQAESQQLKVQKLPYALGTTNEQALHADYPAFFHQDNYQFSTAETEQLMQAFGQEEANGNTITIKTFFGTWCHDSQREVPRMLMLLTSIKQHNIQELIGLSYYKTEPKNRAKAHKIQFTPTFVIFRNELEIGRIIERPEKSLAQDLNAILSKP